MMRGRSLSGNLLLRSARAAGRATLIALVLAVVVSSIPQVALGASPSSPNTAAGEQAFRRLATVLMHPRCLNCHTLTDYPKQGDDRHAHLFRVSRGADDHGAAGLTCSTCHQNANNAASGVPGAPNWHLAPRSMAWEGLSVSQVCRTLKDPARNGARDVDALVAHLTGDPLVQWAWAPGADRTPPPLGQGEFHAVVRAWAEAGAGCPR